MIIPKPNLDKPTVSITYKGGLPESMYNLVNKQIEVEAASSQIYLQMGAWCDPKGYTGAAKFFRKHAEEERKHMLKLYDFLADKNLVAYTPTLTAPQKDYIEIQDVIDTALEHEFYVTSTYEKACELALAEPNHQTYVIMQDLVREQVEEESLFQTIKDKYDILMKGGITGTALNEFDEILGDLAE